jgi:hypothetical protein
VIKAVWVDNISATQFWCCFNRVAMNYCDHRVRPLIKKRTLLDNRKLDTTQGFRPVYGLLS